MIVDTILLTKSVADGSSRATIRYRETSSHRLTVAEEPALQFAYLYLLLLPVF